MLGLCPWLTYTSSLPLALGRSSHLGVLNVSAGYNGGPRGAIGSLCGGEFCERSARCIPSGTQTEIGCHHAEQNAIANAAARGISTEGCVMVVTCSPCLACARLIHHAGIKEVVTTVGYDGRGATYLRNVGVEVSVTRTSER